MLNLEEREEGEGERKVASDNELNFRLLAIRSSTKCLQEHLVLLGIFASTGWDKEGGCLRQDHQVEYSHGIEQS
nr:hypothetical protein CFP56_06960 [Quercus suber]